MIRLILLFLLFSFELRADDNLAFFKGLSSAEWVMVADCAHNSETKVLIFGRSTKEADFAALVNGHVLQMAHIEMELEGFTITDANGGIESYGQVRKDVKGLLQLPFKLVRSDTLQQYVTSRKTSRSLCYRVKAVRQRGKAHSVGRQ